MATVVITGGSRGIGAAAVRRFAARGDRVFFFYEKAHDRAKALEAETGAIPICCDIAREEAVREAFLQIPQVDILICCAGISQVGLFQDVTPEAWDRMFNVNVKGIYHTVRQAIPYFLKQQKGCILTVSSMWGQVGASCEAVYAATKGAVIALTKSLAKELGPSGIRCNCVAPGVILTIQPGNPGRPGRGNPSGAQRHSGGCGGGSYVPGRRSLCHRRSAVRQRRICHII